MPTFRAASFTAAEVWEQPRGPSTDAGVHTLWSMLTVECYSALSRKASLTGCDVDEPRGHHASGIVQSLRDEACLSPLTQGP